MPIHITKLHPLFAARVEGVDIAGGLCIEVHFSEVFKAYRDLGVDCVLLSSYSNDPIFESTARAHASMNSYWLSHSVPTNFEKPLASCIVGPDGHVQARSKAGSGDLAFATIEPNSERWEIPLRKARPWRDEARKGDIYKLAGVKDPRSEDKNNF